MALTMLGAAGAEVRISLHVCVLCGFTTIGGGIDTFCGLNGNRGGELNLGFDEDAALRQYRGMSFDDNLPLQHYLEHADFLAG